MPKLERKLNPTGDLARFRATDRKSPEIIDTPYHEDVPFEVAGDGIEGGCVGGCGGCVGPGCGPQVGFCGPNGCGLDCPPCDYGPCFPNLFRCRTFEVFGGVQGFTGPLNQGGTGSFGFHEGFNFSTKIPRLFCGEWGAQFGLRGVHSNFSGSLFSDDGRNQMFVTAGAFRRVDQGIQVGLAADFLTEDWYVDVDVAQLRGEGSILLHGTGELGLFFRTGLNDANVTVGNQNFTIEPTDVYAMFYRHRFIPCGVGEGRLYAGFSGEGDGLLGSDFRMPLTHSLGLEGGWAYLVPEQPTNQGGLQNEGWNLFMSIVWQPGCPKTDARNYYRPLFRVADNGSFFTDVR